MSPHRAAANRRLGNPGAGSRAFVQATLDWLPAHVAVARRGRRDHHDQRRLGAVRARQRRPPDGSRGELPGRLRRRARGCLGNRAAAGMRAVLSGRAFEFSMEYPCDSETEERWFVLRADRYTGLEGARAVIAHDNVTSRRKAEEEIRTQAALLDEVNVGVVATDADGLITHWNRGAESLYGWTRREAVGRSGARGDRARPPPRSPR